MAEPFIGEIRFFSFDFPPKNWMPCEGQLLAIAQNQALFSLLGIQFGGDGRTTFALPDLRGRAPRHPDGTTETKQGTKAGEENVRLTLDQLPQHNHAVAASSAAGSQRNYEGAFFATLADTEGNLYATPGNLQALNADSVSPTGGSQPHPNCQPSLAGNFCIAISGIFPSRN